MLPLLDSLLGWRLMFLVSSTAMPVSVLLWMGAPFSFLLFPSGWNRTVGKNHNVTHENSFQQSDLLLSSEVQAKHPAQ